MKRSIYTLLLAAAICGGVTYYSNAQNIHGSTQAQPAKTSGGNISDEETKDHWWDCSLPGGNYCISIGKITSVSMHQYIVKSPTQTPGAVPLPARVYEANIATDAALVTRFYYIEAAVDGGAASAIKTGLDRLNQVADQAAERTGSTKFWLQVQKDYPVTTHAHTVEYRLDSKADLDRLYGSVKRSWTVGRGARFTIVNE